MFSKDERLFLLRFALLLALLGVIWWGIRWWGVGRFRAEPASQVRSTVPPGETIRVSVDSKGRQSNDASNYAAISADGRYVSFLSEGKNLVQIDTNRMGDLFRYDLETGEIMLVSVDSSGEQANGVIYTQAISADGRYIAFESGATNLAPDDTNEVPDIFVHDMETGMTRRVSVDSSGRQAMARSANPSISGDGRYIAFESGAAELVPGDTNGNQDIFVHDLQTGNTTRVSVDANGAQANAGSAAPSISRNGRYITFESTATNLAPGETARQKAVFVHDLQTGNTTRVSVDSNGMDANGMASCPSISGDGRYIAFSSAATNLVPNDTNGEGDVFVHDRQTGTTTRVSVDSNGMQANGPTGCPSISADGDYVAFMSSATNLVPDDTNDRQDVFLHAREGGKTTRVSISSDGTQSGIETHGLLCPLPISISGDGQYVVFASAGDNLVPGDTNFALDIFVHSRDSFSTPGEVPVVTDTPTDTPTLPPVEPPTEVPTDMPTVEPVAPATDIPTDMPTAVPVMSPTDAPTDIPTVTPTDTASVTPASG